MTGKIFYEVPSLVTELNHVKRESPTMVFTTSGGFDPLHVGHVRCIQDMSNLARTQILPGVRALVVVIVNGDNFLYRKKGYVFMPQIERLEMIAALDGVDYTVLWNDETQHVCGALERLRPDFFCKGGDRASEEDVPEFKICRDIGCKILFNVGGGKVQSSSELVENYQNVKGTTHI